MELKIIGHVVDSGILMFGVRILKIGISDQGNVSIIHYPANTSMLDSLGRIWIRPLNDAERHFHSVYPQHTHTSDDWISANELQSQNGANSKCAD
jgi:hypothetical protein